MPTNHGPPPDYVEFARVARPGFSNLGIGCFIVALFAGAQFFGLCIILRIPFVADPQHMAAAQQFKSDVALVAGGAAFATGVAALLMGVVDVRRARRSPRRLDMTGFGMILGGITALAAVGVLAYRALA